MNKLSVGPRLVLSLVVLSLSWLVISNALANQSGEQLYSKCAACHSFGYNRTGPDHCGLLDRLAGSLLDFEYTDAMRSSKIVWTADNLNRFLEAPLEVVSGTSMGFIGIADPLERHLLIAYIQAQQHSKDCH